MDLARQRYFVSLFMKLNVSGLWITPPKDTLPVMTVIGSSNYGRRSLERDLESQCYLYTENSDLRQRMKEVRVLASSRARSLPESGLFVQIFEACHSRDS